MKKVEKNLSRLYEDLALLESYIHDLFNFSPLPISFISSSGIILEVNPAFEKISNYNLEEIVGNPIGDFFEKAKIEKLIEDTLKKGGVEGKEVKFFPKGKKEKICQVFTRVRKDEEGNVVGFFLGFFDLTKIRKTEDELRKSQKALLNILEDTEEAKRKIEEEKNKTLTIITNFADGLLVFDKENKLSLINPQAELFLQVKTQEIIGKSAWEISNLENFKPLKNILTKEIKQAYRKELTLRENLVLEISTIPLSFNGEKMGNLIVLHDITREKLVERLKTEFVSLSAHQLRTPLSAIKWILRMLLDGDLGPLMDEQKEFLEKAFYSNERMIHLINDLLNITRIEEGRFLFTFKPVDIVKLTEEIVESFQDEIKRKKIIFEFKKPLNKILQVEGDNEKIKLAIENLIDNAITYTPENGKVTITLEGNQEILFSIKDSGIGIPEEQKERIFNKFFRAKNALKMETEGSGLGLYITKNIIEAHGGKIWFESKENQGSTFYFTLPYKKL